MALHRTILAVLCLLAAVLVNTVLACDATLYLNSIRANDAAAVSQCLASGLIVKPIRDEVSAHIPKPASLPFLPPYRCKVGLYFFFSFRPQNGLSGLQLAVKLGHKHVGLLIAKHALASMRV